MPASRSSSPVPAQWIDLIFERDPATKQRILRESLHRRRPEERQDRAHRGDGAVPARVDREPGGLVIGAAAKRDQAALMLDTSRSGWSGTRASAARRCRSSSRSAATHIYFPELDATYKTIAADAQKEHGLNPHAVIVDEAHATMERPRALRHAAHRAGRPRQPARHLITTAGPMPTGPLYDLYRYGKRSTRASATTRLRDALVRGRSRDCAVDDPEAWRNANPALGCSCARSSSSNAAAAVLSGKAPEFMFRRLHLNQWTTALERWLPYQKVGLPTATRTSRTARTSGSRSTPPSPATRSRSRWSRLNEYGGGPAGEMHARSRSRTSVVKRFKPEHDGGYIDPRDVEIYVLGLAEKYQINRVSYDPAYMGCSPVALTDRGLPMEAFPQSAQRMERATETFQRVFLDERIRHGGDPILLEQIASIATKPTERGVRMTKRGSMPVDMAVALAMALDDALGGEEPEGEDFALAIL
jgi:phage terminase large subunit-like protein